MTTSYLRRKYALHTRPRDGSAESAGDDTHQVCPTSRSLAGGRDGEQPLHPFVELFESDTAATPISEILSQPETYVGRTVRIEGEVTAVCPAMGCWMEVRDPETRRSMRVKVDDGQIVFPKTAKGRRAAAQGKVEKVSLTREQYVAYLEHEAEELRTKADTSGVKTGAILYRIRGTGAVIR